MASGRLSYRVVSTCSGVCGLRSELTSISAVTSPRPASEVELGRAVVLELVVAVVLGLDRLSPLRLALQLELVLGLELVRVAGRLGPVLALDARARPRSARSDSPRRPRRLVLDTRPRRVLGLGRARRRLAGRSARLGSPPRRHASPSARRSSRSGRTSPRRRPPRRPPSSTTGRHQRPGWSRAGPLPARGSRWPPPPRRAPARRAGAGRRRAARPGAGHRRPRADISCGQRAHLGGQPRAGQQVDVGALGAGVRVGLHQRLERPRARSG